MHFVCLVALLLGLLSLSGKTQITGLVHELLGGEVESGASSQTHGEEERVNLNGDLGALLGVALELVSETRKRHVIAHCSMFSVQPALACPPPTAAGNNFNNSINCSITKD